MGRRAFIEGMAGGDDRWRAKSRLVAKKDRRAVGKGLMNDNWTSGGLPRDQQGHINQRYEFNDPDRRKTKHFAKHTLHQSKNVI